MSALLTDQNWTYRRRLHEPGQRGVAAASGPGLTTAGRILGSVSVATVSLQLDETRKFAAGCFTQGPSF